MNKLSLVRSLLVVVRNYTMAIPAQNSFSRAREYGFLKLAGLLRCG